jgi:spore germination protein
VMLLRIRKILILLVVMLLTLGLTGTAMAEEENSPGIRIDGKLRKVDPPPQILESRTMIPLRFVIEDDALKGQVYWDEGLQKVAMDVRGQYIEFFIGDNKARVDGEVKYFDAPPYIYEGRTYIPLRFLAENLGALVGWKAVEREVIIDFDHRPEVFAYYYYTTGDELKDNLHLFTDIAFRWFQTNAKGELSYEYKDDYENILQMVRNQGVRTHASVVLMGKDPVHRLLSSKNSRAQLIGNLLDEVKKSGYDGVNIDFELMRYQDANLFTSFLEELKTSLGPDKTLSVAVYARTGKETWPTPYQYKRIGKIADRVVVMAYDYSFTTSKPGPVAPLWWVKDTTDYMIKSMPREKILLGMPTYGYNWSPGHKTVTVTAKKLADIKRRYQVEEFFDQKSMSPYYVYYDENGSYHVVWLENEQSLSEKWNVAIENRLGGISFWRIGNGFDDLYKILERNLHQ